MRIAVLHAGGVGDLVLAETLFAALRERHPDARLELICRADVAPVASLYASPPDAIHPFAFDPYRWDVPSEAVAARIRTVAESVGPGIELFVSAELRATWLGEVLAAILAPEEAVLGDPRDDRNNDVAILLRRFGVAPHPELHRLAEVPGEHELDRYARLAGAPARRLPALRTPAGAETDGPWLAVFPAGAPVLKQWPLERTVSAATAIAGRLGARVVLVGSERERPALEAAAARFATAPEILAGTTEGLPAIAERLAGARAYLGIDSGLPHLAAAYGVPGVTIYGGGTWPAYAPWAPGSSGVVAPIPCFGCGWDCAFEHAFCIDGVGEDAVVAAFDALSAQPEHPAVVALDAYTARERAILGTAGAVHRTAQADRAARLVAITRLRDVMRRYAGRTKERHIRVAGSAATLSTAVEQAALQLTRWKHQ
jgi:heptosyltransferase-2